MKMNLCFNSLFKDNFFRLLFLVFFLSNFVFIEQSFSKDQKKQKTLTNAQALDLVKIVDDRQRNSGDYKSNAFIRETEKDKEPRVYQAVVYRRDLDNKFMILFVGPSQEAGKGYLKIDKNLWFYDPNTGKWERRTERERIIGTNSRRADFDESRLAEEYDVKFEGSAKLGPFEVYKILLTVKKGIDVAYPKISLWLDVKTSNVLKREEYSLSGKLMRTTFYPKWSKQYSESKKADVWVPQEMRIFDNLEKGNTTVILIKDVDLNALQANIFTKAWVESKSR
jgi:outer membrane lipoprotein-sorting protein